MLFCGKILKHGELSEWLMVPLSKFAIIYEKG